MDGCAFWSEESRRQSLEAMGALWRSYPASLVRTLLKDLIRKNVGLADEIEDIPEASQLACRTGGASLLTTRISAAFGVNKFDALMSGVATSTRKGYTRLRYERVRFCAIRRHGPWLLAADSNWGGN